MVIENNFDVALEAVVDLIHALLKMLKLFCSQFCNDCVFDEAAITVQSTRSQPSIFVTTL